VDIILIVMASQKAFYGNELPLYEKNNLSIISNDYE